MVVAEEVSQWIVRLSHGDEQAARVLWEQYFTKLVHYARRKLGCLQRSVQRKLVTIRRIWSEETSL